jgi:hypothetical protein
MKNWKNLFVKSDEEEVKADIPKSTEQYNFPVNSNTSTASATTPSFSVGGTTPADQSAVNEVLGVYEKGIDSINMPGYDFYEFYKAIGSISNAGEQAYIMAYQMAKSMDNTLTPQKLVADAEFYISKINEVHSQYTTQGQQKINALQTKKNEEKSQLNKEIEQGIQQIAHLRSQLHTIESDVNLKKSKLTTIEGSYIPQETAIKQKLLANDNAKQISTLKLITVKEGIQKNIKF